MSKELSKLFVTIGLDDKEFGKGLDKLQKNLTQMGKVMTGIGAGLVAGFGLAAKSAEDERLNIARLDSMLQNVGVSYDEVSASLEKNIAVMQRKTGIADDQQRDALAELVFATGDYQKAVELLPTALDLMAAKQMDAKTAAELLGKVAQGQFGTLSRYGIVLKDDATAADALAAIQDKVSGSAEKMASPMAILQATFGDLVEKVGGNLLPVLQRLVDIFVPIIEKIGAWMEQNPKLTETIILVAGAVGALFAMLGPILMMLPAIAAGFTMLLGPVGLVMLAITALTAATVLIIKNWSNIKDFFAGVWDGIVNVFKTAIGLIIDYINLLLSPLNLLIEGLNKIPGINISKLKMPGGAEILPSFAAGGIVPGPIGSPVPIIAHGGERFLGVNGGGAVNITGNNFYIREEADIQRVARELYRLQQVRT